jgi:flavin reductase (DIM6/NTAB) family NADH-FMN oxidoreductase RutF
LEVRGRGSDEARSGEEARRRFRTVFGHFPTGVAVITGVGPDGPRGLTVSAVSSLSLDPLLMIVCLASGARTLRVVRETGRFGVNVLRSDQERLSRLFASKGPEHEKFTGVGWSERDGVAVLDDVLAWLGCDLVELLPGGDHTIGIGAVTAMEHAEGEPLVFYRGAYRSLHDAAASDP